MSNQETVFYEDDAVCITNSRAVIGGTTYAIANITSVTQGKINPDTRPGLAIILVSGMCTLCMVLQLLADIVTVQSTTASIGGLIMHVFMVLVFAGGTYYGYYLLQVAKAKYVVRLQTSGGEVDALVRKDMAYIEKIVDALNKAMISRG